MIILVCGMIGSGKTTWANKQNKLVSDSDMFDRKYQQIKYTLDHEHGNIVYHITCFPTLTEMLEFSSTEKRYIWINTSFSQCRKNFLQRGRTRDIIEVSDTLDKNEEILYKYMKSSIDFKIINVFETNERW